jgi:hypothetical protein
MTHNLKAVIEYARRGWPVLPCRSDKKPMLPRRRDAQGIPIRKTGGLYQATTDGAQIRQWWECWPYALIGVRMGRASGCWALDIDAPERQGEPDGVAAWAGLVEQHGGCIATHAHYTPSGGMHLLFKWDEARPVGNSTGSLPAGIHVRGENSYLIVPPSRLPDGRAYHFADDGLLYFEFSAAPTWLFDLLLKGDVPSPAVGSPRASLGERRERAWAQATLAGCAHDVATAVPGTRNNELNAKAYRAGRLVGGGFLGQGEAENAMKDAALANGLVQDDGMRVAEDTIARAISAGIEKPHPGPADQANGSGTAEPAPADRASGNGAAKSGPADGANDSGTAEPGSADRVNDDGTAEPGPADHASDDGTAEPDPADHANGNGTGALGVTIDKFVAYLPSHKYLFIPTCELWPAASVNARVSPQPLLDQHGNPVRDKDGKPKTIQASLWLDQNSAVQQMTWAPGYPQIIEDRLVLQGGWKQQAGCRCWNQYQPPRVSEGNARAASRWVEHVRRIYPHDAEHIIRYLAHRAQRPHEKINHVLVLGGEQGIGKDTLLEPVKYAVGHWNFIETSPQHLLGRFNPFAKSVILRISEARDLGDYDRFALYDHLKTYAATPPDVLRVDEKYTPEYSVFNVTGLIITSNHKLDGIFLPPDDRRHYVAWSDLTQKDFDAAYWNDLWQWYENGGIADTGAYLREFDLSDFYPKAPPPKTAAWFDIVASSHPPEDSELSDVLDELSRPPVVTLAELAEQAKSLYSKTALEFGEWLLDRKNSRRIPHRLESCGYERLRNTNAEDGLWKINGRRQAIYANKELSLETQMLAASERYSIPTRKQQKGDAS